MDKKKVRRGVGGCVWGGYETELEFLWVWVLTYVLWERVRETSTNFLVVTFLVVRTDPTYNL